MNVEVRMGDKKPKEKQESSPLGREIDARIRDLYNETLNEDVPDRFAKLLKDLREKEQGK